MASQVKKEAQKGDRTDGASQVAGMQFWDANRALQQLYQTYSI